MCLFICLFVCLCVCLFICVFVCLFVCLFICLFVCVFVYLFVCLFVYLFVCCFTHYVNVCDNLLTAGGSISFPRGSGSPPRNNHRGDGPDTSGIFNTPIPKPGNYKLHFVKLCKFQDFESVL